MEGRISLKQAIEHLYAVNEGFTEQVEGDPMDMDKHVRLEKIIRGMERMAHGGSSDSVKMSAMAKLMDFQQEQVKILLAITNIEKAQKIEALTRRFFQEIRKTGNLDKVADRYLAMLNDLD